MLTLELDLETLWKVGSIHISRGNKKLSRRVGNFNLPACRTCPFFGICRDYCYAIKAEKWKYVTCSRWDNFYASRRTTFVDEMVAKITKMRLKVIRVHESGDVYNRTYAEDLAEIARRLPDRRFYLYTKSLPYVAALKQLPNFTVIFSYGGARDDLIDRQTDNYARVIDSLDEVEPGEYLCPAVAHAETEDQKICGKWCTYCQGVGHQLRVCFIKETKGKNWKTNNQLCANSAASALTANQAARCDDDLPHVSKATLAYDAKATLKEDIKAKQKRKTPYVSMASEFRCLDVMASSRPVDKASEVVDGEVK
jgi:Gene product 88